MHTPVARTLQRRQAVVSAPTSASLTYDQDGDGKFERMEFMPVVIGGDPAWPWHPQLPIWTRAQ